MIYDKFQRMDALSLPDRYPYTITMLTESGDLKTQTISKHGDLDLRKAASVKVHKPERTHAIATEVVEHFGVYNPEKLKTVHRIVEFLDERGYLKVDGQPQKEWLDQKMDELGIKYTNVRKGIRNWFYDPDNYPEVNYDLDNKILTVKPVPGGRVVVAPSGHTIAYSAAKEIYWAMIGSGMPYSDYPVVGEYVGGQIRHNRNHRLDVTKTGVGIGCQRVPRKAIEELAEREGWSKNPSY